MKFIKMQVPNMPKELLLPLYTLANELYEANPCRFLQENHIFALQNPLSKVVGYITFEEENGKLSSLCIYRGEKSLENYFIEDLSEINIYDALVLDYVKVADLPQDEKSLVKDLSSSLAKKSFIPSFRSFLPEFQGWYLNEEEILFFTLALECTLLHLQECLTNEKLRFSGENGVYQLYTLVEGSFVAHTHIPRPSILTKELPYANTTEVEELKSIKLCRDSAWEISFFYTPSLIREHKHPYFGRVFLIVHQESSLVLQIDVAEPGTPSLTLLGDELLATIKTHKRIPSEIILNDEKLYEGIWLFAKSLGIEASLVSTLPATQAAKEALIEHMQ